MGSDWLHSVQLICQNLLSSKADVFVAFGLNVVMGLAAIRLVLFGIGTAINAADGRQGMNWGGFVRHILVIGTALTMLRGYTTPVAGLGQTFPEIVMGGPLYLAHQIGDESYKALDQKLADIQKGNPPQEGGPFAIGMTLGRWAIDLEITLTRGVMLLILCYGFIGSAVCALVGPIFIPFLLFEPLAFMFWGWFKCFLQYAFYPVIGAAYTHIFASLLANVMLAPLSGDLTDTLAAMVALQPLIVLVNLGMLHAPKMCSALFSGSAGDHGGVGTAIVGAITR